MNRTSVAKRFWACVVAMTLVCACIFTSYAGALTPFMGDSSTEVGQVKITTNGGYVDYEIGERSSSTRTRYTGSPALGTFCKLSARDTATRVFMYWLDDLASRVYSYDRTITFTVSSGMSIRAVFATVSDTAHHVSFVNYGGTIMSDNSSYALGESVSMPTDTKVPGFTFKGWSASADEIKNSSDDMIVYPKYKVNDESYTVEITNDAYVSGAGTYTNFQTVNLKADERNGAGESFSCWKDADGNVVSYERNYSFRINYNTTLTAVYGESVTPEPIVRITKINRDQDDMKITFYAERSVPEEYTVVSHGMLMATGNVTDMQMTVGNSGEVVRKVYGTSNEQCGTFSLAKTRISYVTQVTVRPFVITQNAEGNQFITYGDIIRTTNGEA